VGVDGWLERYRGAWEQGDADAAAALFTEDAVYRSSPFREPHIGQDGIRDYWAQATGSQSDTRVKIGRPVTQVVAAADTVMNRPSGELMAEVYPSVPYRPTAGDYDTRL
jgi:uncharacterized protein (TIGR02246 family)